MLVSHQKGLTKSVNAHKYEICKGRNITDFSSVRWKMFNDRVLYRRDQSRGSTLKERETHFDYFQEFFWAVDTSDG